mgnify:CR=1 FL=1
MVEFIRDKLINKNPPLRITGRTPLHVAAQRGYLDVIECIFECLWKEDRNPRDDTGITPLHLAATFGQLEALKMFLKGCRNLGFEILYKSFSDRIIKIAHFKSVNYQQRM